MTTTLEQVVTSERRAVRCLSQSGFHNVSYQHRGSSSAGRKIVCVHGLTRNSHDFDALADVLAREAEVAAVDVVGRGRSDLLPTGAQYNYPQYMADMAVVLAHLQADRVEWVGTSMGGLIGMMLAAQPNSPIGKLVINDIGALVPKDALQRIASYVGQAPAFRDMDEVEAYERRVHAPFGPMTDAQWRRLAETSVWRSEDGGYRLAYDPKIAEAFATAAIQDIDLWAIWDRITCPVLLLRGAESDVLPRDVAVEMTRRGPKAQLVEFARYGHAPALNNAEQIAVIREWLAGNA